MRIVFMGTPDFAATCLARLLKQASHEVVSVFSQPDKRSGRGMKLTPTAVKSVAEEHGIAVFQPATLKSHGASRAPNTARTENATHSLNVSHEARDDGEALRLLRELAPDLIIVVAYGRLLPSEILELPRLGCVNIHASLLPKYRGSAPIQRAVLAGETVTGATAMYMAEELDAGDIIASRETEIREGETSGELFLRLAELGAELLCDTVDAIANGTAAREPQEHSAATFAPMLSKAESPVDLTRTAHEVTNHINGLDPWPCATLEVDGTAIKLFRARRGVHEGGLVLPCSNGKVTVMELQGAGGRRMSAADYLRGKPICL